MEPLFALLGKNSFQKSPEEFLIIYCSREQVRSKNLSTGKQNIFIVVTVPLIHKIEISGIDNPFGHPDTTEPPL